MKEGYQLVVEVPSAEDYRRLRIAAGLSPKSAEGAAAGLPNSLFAVLIKMDGKVVGVDRVVGDGGRLYQVWTSRRTLHTSATALARRSSRICGRWRRSASIRRWRNRRRLLD
jgi:hypothetical protein